jgi:hypothetical protein
MEKKKSDSKAVWLLVLPVLLAGLAMQGCGKNMKKEAWDDDGGGHQGAESDGAVVFDQADHQDAA